MELENTTLSEVSQDQKDACFLSYMEYRPNTNTTILRKTGHTTGHRGGHIQEEEGKRRKLRR
jgi:hypothetical protein